MVGGIGPGLTSFEDESQRQEMIMIGAKRVQMYGWPKREDRPAVG